MSQQARRNGGFELDAGAKREGRSPLASECFVGIAIIVSCNMTAHPTVRPRGAKTNQPGHNFAPPQSEAGRCTVLPKDVASDDNAEGGSGPLSLATPGSPERATTLWKNQRVA